MAIYAPTSAGIGTNHKKVASLVTANPNVASTSLNNLSSINIDGSNYNVNKKLIGLNGTIPYLGRNDKDDYSPETILRNDIFICENTDDYAKSKNYNISQKEIFDTWIRGGLLHLGGDWKSYSYDSDYTNNTQIATLTTWFEYNKANPSTTNGQPTSYTELEDATWDKIIAWKNPHDAVGRYGANIWYYSNKLGSIFQPINTSDIPFFISPFNLLNYDIIVKCHSPNTDDDLIGLIIAVRYVNGKPRPLYVFRTPNNQNPDDSPFIPQHFFISDENIGIQTNKTTDTKFNSNLSANFIWSRECFLTRFGLYNADHTLVPCANQVRAAYNNAHPLSYEVNNCNSLYKVKVPTTHNAETKYNWENKVPQETIDPHNLSAPENWWWMNTEQWNNHYSYCYGQMGWDKAGHSYIRIKREGNLLSAWATKFTGSGVSNKDNLTGDINGSGNLPKTDSEWVTAVNNGDAALLTVDFNNTSDKINGTPIKQWNSTPNEGSPVGFVSYSQAFTTYEIIKLQLSKIIVKTYENKIVQYNPIDDTETEIPNIPTEYCGKGRLCKNLATGKTFYVSDNSFILINNSKSETWSFTTSDGKTITKQITLS